MIPGEKIMAVCPLNRVGLHERNCTEFSPGQIRAFHLRRVEPVYCNGTPRLVVVIDRVSKTLVDTLLQEQPDVNQEKIKIRCVKRFVGHKSKVASSLRIALTELTSGNVGQIIGKADENRVRGIILVVQQGSLLTKQAAYPAGKVIISMIQAFVGRVYSSGRNVSPSLVMNIDEAQSVLYHGIEDLFAKAGRETVKYPG